MKAKLVNHTFPDDHDWVVIMQDIPLGRIYEVVGFEAKMRIIDLVSGKTRIVDCYLVSDGIHQGYVPTICFEVIDDEPQQLALQFNESEAVKQV